MSDLELVNLFNSLFVSSSRVVLQNGRYRVYLNNVMPIFLLPLVISITTGLAGCAVIWKDIGMLLDNVFQLSSIARFASLSIVVFAMSAFFLLEHKQFNALLERLILYDHRYNRVANQWETQVKLPLVRVQLLFVCVLFALIVGTRLVVAMVFAPGIALSVLLLGSSLIELYFFLHQLYLQFFVEHITLRFRLLRHKVAKKLKDRKDLVQEFRLYDEILSMRQLMANFIGLRCLLVTLLAFLNCAIISYGILYLIDLGSGIAVLHQEGFILITWVTLFFGTTYQFDQMNQEEQKFKNAIKLVQYDKMKHRSKEFLNFLDFINLKLKIETPKITACGLFTVDLQVFHNVVVAIVTYIMILFQFRDFEK